MNSNNGKAIEMLCRSALLCFAAILCGCGATKSYTATEQLLLSDAVDATIAKLDFSPLRQQKVYLDVTYLKTVRSPLLIDSDYVISSVRQQMLADDVLLVESREEADLIAEARLGALGLDGHSVTYGLPASNAIATATAAIASAPVLPSLPELSVARHESKLGAAKIAVFAYDRITRQPIWQSGIARSSSNAKDTWVLGVGPFQRGTIYKRTRFAGDQLAGSELLQKDGKDIRESQQYHDYRNSRVFPALYEATDEAKSEDVVAANSEETVAEGASANQ